MTAYVLVPVTGDEWDVFLRDSPQGSAFCSSWFLSCYGGKADYWLLRDESGSVVAGVPVLHEVGGGTYRQVAPFSMYVGPVLARKVCDLPLHSRGKYIPEVLGALMLELVARYDRLALSFHHRHCDLRGVQWLLYAAGFSGELSLQLRYTAIVSLPNESDRVEWLRSMRLLRRREIMKTQKAGYETRLLDDVVKLRALYELTFLRQGSAVSEEHLDLVEKIAAAALHSGHGVMPAITDEDGTACSVYLFLMFGDTAYYLFGANDPESRRLSPSTQLMYDSAALLYDKGMRRLDFCGANSPNRGDFKTSFNAELVPYFDVGIRSEG